MLSTSAAAVKGVVLTNARCDAERNATAEVVPLPSAATRGALETPPKAANTPEPTVSVEPNPSPVTARTRRGRAGLGTGGIAADATASTFANRPSHTVSSTADGALEVSRIKCACTDNHVDSTQEACMLISQRDRLLPQATNAVPGAPTDVTPFPVWPPARENPTPGAELAGSEPQISAARPPLPP